MIGMGLEFSTNMETSDEEEDPVDDDPEIGGVWKSLMGDGPSPRRLMTMGSSRTKGTSSFSLLHWQSSPHMDSTCAFKMSMVCSCSWARSLRIAKLLSTSSH